MSILRVPVILVTVIMLGIMVTGCATNSGGDAGLLKTSNAKAWSLKGTDDGMSIAVSPVRRTVQIAGASAAILGAAFDAAANSQYRSKIEGALGDYNPGLVLEEHLKQRLVETMGDSLEQVPPLTTTAGQKNQKDAEKARIQGLRRGGKQVVLDLKATYGIFGPEGTLVAKLDGNLIDVTTGKRVWSDAVLVSMEPILASAALNDPTKTMAPNLSSPRLSAEKDAIDQWTGDGGARFKAEYEHSVKAVVSALLCNLHMVREAEGEYFLGKIAMNRKEFEVAEQHFKNAYAIDANMPDALNGVAANLGYQKDYEEAIAFGNKVAERFPDYAPIRLNLAWWYAVGQNDADSARPHYEKALSLGLAPEPKIEKVLNKKQ